jgi:hypothetical protein
MKKYILILIMTLIVGMNISTATNIIGNEIFLKNNSFRIINDIVWNNGIEEITTPFSSQLGFFEDEIYDVFTADDFIFNEEIVVTSVFWTGIYFNCQNAQGPKDYQFPWNITFFEDDGSGHHPGNIIAGPFLFPDDEITKDFWLEIDLPTFQAWAANYTIELSEPVAFKEGKKYWITIYGYDDLFPQSGVALHSEEMGGIQLNEVNVKSQYWYNHGAYPTSDWFNVSEYEAVYDMNFILYGFSNSPPEILEIDGYSNGNPGKVYGYEFTNCVDSDGDDMTYHVEWGDGGVDEGFVASGGAFTLSHTWTEAGDYSIKAKLVDIYGSEGDWATFDVSIPREKNVFNQAICYRITHFNILFTLLQILVKAIK